MDEHGPIITRAPDYAARANMGHGKFFLSTSHNITNHLCEIDGDTAYCESYTVGGLFWQDGKTTTIAFGRYIDQLERRGGEWRLLTRRCTIEMTADTDASWVYSANVKGFLKPHWSRDDASYQRPVIASTQGERW
ncbi:nuclear transport factor 2 family protein [Sphingobium yanoikuyae]|uniref:nuclear transport factor 2 family protein n=1 Tax=Sphingobium yanoikuyae TaxID=13690 RepID=UPI0028AEB1B9|nr:nuclear transport factor 2 family protein [Sphingobium yanoikuyae]